jgi:hypothetical protein
MRTRLTAILTISLLSAATVSANAQSAKLMMDCHEMDGGSPSPHASFYEVRGNDLLRHGRTRIATISSAGKMLFLSRTQDDKGPEDAFASHVRNGHVVVRTVYWQRPGQKMRKAFQETYDFRARTITRSTGGGDTCHHDAWKGDEEG